MTCTCLKISNVIQLWVNSYCCSHDKVWKPPLVWWTRTGATFFVFQQFVNAHEMQHATICVKHMIQKYSGMSEVWKQTSHMIYSQQSWVTLLTVHLYLPSILLVLTLTSSCHQIHTHGVHQLCSAGSVNCLFTDCDQWYSWTFNCPDVTVQPVNYKEWSRDADTLVYRLLQTTEDGCRTPASRHWKPLVLNHTEIWPASIWISDSADISLI